MSDNEREKTEEAVRREQRFLWGGTSLIIAIVVAGAGMLAVEVPWHWTLLMIPISAIGALMTFEARASAHARQAAAREQATREWLKGVLDQSRATVHAEHVELFKRQTDMRISIAELKEEVELGRSATRAELAHLIEGVAQLSEALRRDVRTTIRVTLGELEKRMAEMLEALAQVEANVTARLHGLTEVLEDILHQFADKIASIDRDEKWLDDMAESMELGRKLERQRQQKPPDATV